MPPTPRNPIDQAELNKLASDMKSGDVNRARAACRTLADAAPIEENRGDVARLLERLLTAQDEGLRGDAVRALGIWGDSRSVELLTGCLQNEAFGARESLFDALGRLDPTEAAAEAVVAWLSRDPGARAERCGPLGPSRNGRFCGLRAKLRT